MNIPSFLQSSVDQNSVSLTITSIGKAVAGFITFLGVVGWIDPSLTTAAAPAWGGFVASVLAGVPAAFAVWHSGMAVWGVMRKIGIRILPIITPKA